MKNQLEFLDILTIMSFVIALQNLQENNEQTKALEEHLQEQDKQYEEIIRLLKKGESNEQN